MKSLLNFKSIFCLIALMMWLPLNAMACEHCERAGCMDERCGNFGCKCPHHIYKCVTGYTQQGSDNGSKIVCVKNS